MPFVSYTVTLDNDGIRADKLVSTICSNLSYAFVQKLFRTGKVKNNNKKLKASDRVWLNNSIKIYANVQEKEKKQATNEKLQSKFQELIIYENDDFLAINKPNGLAVQSGTNVSFCVEDLMKSISNAEYRLVHRLDKDTSGVLLIAKNRQSAQHITGLFRQNKIRKKYIAIVDGKIKLSGKIDNYLSKYLKGNEEKIRVTDFGQRAITLYKPIKKVGFYTLLELLPQTGRKHQLRVHCADVLKTPILGDVKYNDNILHKQLFLHAHSIQINDLTITADIPQHFIDVLES